MSRSRYPSWWQPADAAATAAYLRWDAGADGRLPIPPEACAAFCCRRCRHWAGGAYGAEGWCCIPVTPATVNCGPTRPDDGCEQWQPRR